VRSAAAGRPWSIANELPDFLLVLGMLTVLIAFTFASAFVDKLNAGVYADYQQVLGDFLRGVVGSVF